MLQKMSSLSARLGVRKRSPETIQPKDLVGQPPSLIVGARKVTTRYGRMATILNIQRGDIVTSIFLPNKYTESLDESDLQTIVQEGYELSVKLDKDGTTPLCNIEKKK